MKTQFGWKDGRRTLEDPGAVGVWSGWGQGLASVDGVNRA